ncbi:hypothetical protein [Neobacillus sp. LXY-4]|uniref:hypothetical protein n=1 Tax=Neobacillus sp. LXY-4 TaxID=3379826 RepID=UPI003EDF0D10
MNINKRDKDINLNNKQDSIKNMTKDSSTKKGVSIQKDGFRYDYDDSSDLK